MKITRGDRADRGTYAQVARGIDGHYVIQFPQLNAELDADDIRELAERWSDDPDKRALLMLADVADRKNHRGRRGQA